MSNEAKRTKVQKMVRHQAARAAQHSLIRIYDTPALSLQACSRACGYLYHRLCAQCGSDPIARTAKLSRLASHDHSRPSRSGSAI